MIHDTAIIDPSAEISSNVEIGPYSVVGPNVCIDEGTVIGPHVVINGPTEIGKNNRIFQFASVGEDCQDKKYAGEPTKLVMGDNNVIRESVTIHRGTTQDQGITSVGSHNLFMAYAHVAHDCVIGDHGIFANACTLAGHVHVGDWAIMGGLSAVHQFCHVGSHCFVGGGTIVLRDVAPYVMLGNDGKPHGINSEGLRRRGFDSDTILNIKRAYKILFRQGNKSDEAVAKIRELAPDNEQVTCIADFVENSPRGLVR